MGIGSGGGTGTAAAAAAQAAAVAAAGAPIPPKNVVEAILAWRMPLSSEEKEQQEVGAVINVLSCFRWGRFEWLFSRVAWSCKSAVPPYTKDMPRTRVHQCNYFNA
jgi:hypothetical protein